MERSTRADGLVIKEISSAFTDKRNNLSYTVERGRTNVSFARKLLNVYVDLCSNEQQIHRADNEMHVINIALVDVRFSKQMLWTNYKCSHFLPDRNDTYKLQ